LWRILRAYGILKEIVLTKSFYNNFTYDIATSGLWHRQQFHLQCRT
jgi:hypothetical protein